MLYNYFSNNIKTEYIMCIVCEWPNRVGVCLMSLGASRKVGIYGNSSNITFSQQHFTILN